MSGGLGLSRSLPLASGTRETGAIRLSAMAAAVIFCGLHIPLGICMEQFRAVGTVHALGTVAVGLWCAAVGRQPHRVALVAAYITGSEVLWRMTKAGVIWEMGKYAVSAILLLGMGRSLWTRVPLFPVLYFAFLIPSSLITLMDNDLSQARMYLSFNLSGPFSLMVCACFFYGRQMSLATLRRILLAFIGPVLGVAAVAVFGITTAEELSFGSESNAQMSGGFGPNQVSAVLGLGALLAFLSTLTARESSLFRTGMLIVTLALAAQSAMTFSRGGLYAAVGAAGLAALYMARHRQTRIRLALATAMLALVGYFVLFPLLDGFTEGALARRFGDTSPTGRDVVLQADLEIWQRNLLLGVGPGQATELRAEWHNRRVAGHTEFTRLLSEHGLLGLLSLFLLGMLAMRNYSQARGLYGRALAVALMGWSLLFMMNSGMRLAAPGFIFGLASARLLIAETDTWTHLRRSHRTAARRR